MCTGEGAPKLDDEYWSELSQEQQRNATIIGCTAKGWNSPPNYCQDWVHLTDELKSTASLLGKLFVLNFNIF